MFHDRSLARLLPTAALAALALCFAHGAVAFPEELEDPGAPPSEFPDHSGEMNNFGSKFIFSFSETVGTFVPRAVINCNTCTFPVNPAVAHTFSLTGRVLGQIRNNDGTVNSSSRGVYDMNITITGVKATVSTVDVGGGFSEQTITYTANLTGAAPFNAEVSGQLVLDLTATPSPNPPPADGTTIKVGARAGAGGTPDLVTAPGPSQTFPAIPASSPQALGQAIAANVVFQVTETKRGRTPPPVP